MKKKILLIFVLICCLISCRNKTAEVSQEFENKVTHINIQESVLSETNKLIDKNAKYVLLYYFDGSCAYCIGSFIDWLKKWQSFDYSENINCIYISSDADIDVISYYLEKSGVILNINSSIFIDKDNKFQDDNPNLYINEGFYLLDNNYDVIIYGDPVDSEKVRREYLKLKLL